MIGTIIQARMGSTRLPGKVLKSVLGKPLLVLMIERVRLAGSLDKVVVAIPDTPENDPLERLCADNGIDCARGSENDVLSRYYHAAKKFGIDPVVRLTSDCPLIDPAIIDHSIKLYKKERCDYLTNAIDRTYPDGQDIEIISFKALEAAFLEATDKHDREHVTTYIGCRPERFKHRNFRYKKDLSKLRWTVDYPEDFMFVEAVFRELYPKKGAGFSMEDVLELLDRKPEIGKINSDVVGKDNLKIAKENLGKKAGS
ncbi:MAG: glycosyltransferase family protein [Candidatus Micrarchaeota archaeon]